MKAESRHIPHKLAARLKFIYCLQSIERIPATTVFCKCCHLLQRTMKQEKGELTNCQTIKEVVFGTRNN